jgi:hypothetical protein
VTSTRNTDLGRVGEFLAAYILETYGIEVHHVDRAGADLWCRANNTIFTVQVKAASRPTKSNDHTSVGYYGFHTKSTSADWFCFVALDRQLLLMRRVADVTTTSLRLAPSEFNEANQRRSIDAVLNST